MRSIELSANLLLTTVLISCGQSVFAGSGDNTISEADRTPKPNILFIVADDLGVMDIGAYNEDCFYDTPHLDALAGTGMRFDRAYVTSPVCSPSRYTLMTGKYPSRVHATNFFSGKRKGTFDPAEFIDHMPLEEVTIAELLQEEGYATFFAGKWHLGPDVNYFPQNQGFDINQGGHHAGGPYTGNEYFSPFKNPQLQPDSPEGEHLPDRLARETAAFIDQHKDRPFLACLYFYSVHTPLMGREDLVEKYEGKKATVSGEEFGPEEWVPTINPHGRNTGELQHAEFRKVRILQNHAVYAAMVEAMDEAVGTVLKQLEDSGVAENTIVIFTSDHGGLSTSDGWPTSNRPYRGGKGWLYEGGIRVPFLIRYPGVAAPGSSYSGIVSTLDLYPTLAQAAGADIAHEIDGLNLTEVLKGGAFDRGPLYWHYPHYANQGGFPGGVIMEGDYKLIQRYEDGRVQLYNLKDDISEKNDLSQEQPEVVDRLESQFHDWLKIQNARFLQEREDSGPAWRPY
jgi:arylsulfatase A-like enzyme